MKRIILIIVIICAPFALGIFVSWWLALSIGLIILGTLGYVERIFNIKLPRKWSLLFLLLFILLSVGNIIRSNHSENVVTEAKKQVEKEREARLRLEEQLAPRKLTAQQRLQFIGLLKANPEPIMIMVPMNDSEAGNFSEMIKDALEKAGWSVGTGYTLPVNIPPGLTTNSDLVQQALSAIGFEARGLIDQRILHAGWGKTLLLVGSKQ